MADRGKIKGAIDEWMAWYKKVSDTLIERQPNIYVTNDLAQRKACAYVGVRRCGKTYLAIQASKNLKIAQDQTLYFNFEEVY